MTHANATAWLAAGVNRISLGVQSFDDAVLKWMHRVHDAAAVSSAMSMLRSAGFTNVSVDLIFALPEALQRDWARDLDLALALEPEHLSLYGLTIEEGTPLGRWTARGESMPSPDERYAAEYLAAHRALTAAGFEHYEVSNAGSRGPPGPAQQRVLAARTVHRARAVGAFRLWVAPVLECPRVGAATSGWPTRTASRSGPKRRYWTRSSCGSRSSTSGFARPMGSPASCCRQRPARRGSASGWAEASDGRVRLTPEGWLRLDALVRSVA